MKNVCVVYDISDDTKRELLARRLIYYGLHRVQYSVFDGMMDEREIKPMVNDIEMLGLAGEDKVLIIELCDGCLRKSINLGKNVEIREHIII